MVGCIVGDLRWDSARDQRYENLTETFPARHKSDGSSIPRDRWKFFDTGKVCQSMNALNGRRCWPSSREISDRRGDNSDKEHERHERRRSQPAPSLTMWRRSQSRRRQRFQFKDEIVSGLKSLLRPFREAVPHDAFELRRDAGQLRWLVVQNCADRL